VVDFYLFDLRRGYCDYAASAMVVMSRAVGLPSRLVIGYAPGRFEPASGQIVITEAEAHSWPEIYFSGAGWVAFEPTGGRPPVELPVVSLQAAETQAPALPAPVTGATWRDLLWPALAGLGALVLLIWGWKSWRSVRGDGVASLIVLYAGLHRSARRLGAPDWPGLTPGEMAIGLGRQVEWLGKSGRWWARLSPAGAEARRLAGLYSQAIYSSRAPEKAVVEEARNIWRRLRWRLWFIVLVERLKSLLRA
jgi:hypothetical protein